MFVWECLVIITPIQIRAYTGRGKFSETSWSQPISTDPDNTAILVGITVPIVLLVIILLVIFKGNLSQTKWENLTGK